MIDITMRERQLLDEAIRHARAYDAQVAAASFANPMTAVGDLIVGGALGVATRKGAGANGSLLRILAGTPDYLGPGAQGTILTLDAGAPAWRYKPELGFLRSAAPTAETDWFEAGSLDAKWTVFGSATTAFTPFGEIELSIPFSGAGTHALRGISQPVPSGNWGIAAPLANYAPTIAMSGGLFASDGTKYVTLLDIVRVSIGTGPIGEQMAVTNWNNTTTPIANPFGPITVDEFRREPWFQLRYDGTNLLWDWAPNGRRYQNIGSATIASFLTNTPTIFGLIGNSPVAAGTGIWGYRAFLCYHDANLNH